MRNFAWVATKSTQEELTLPSCWTKTFLTVVSKPTRRWGPEGKKKKCGAAQSFHSGKNKVANSFAKKQK